MAGCAMRRRAARRRPPFRDVSMTTTHRGTRGAPDEARPLVLSEQAERELVGFRTGMTHRWWMAGGLLVVLAVPILTGIFQVGLGVLVAIMTSSFALNGLLFWATSRPERWRPAYRWLIPLLDITTISLVQFAFGNYGLVAIYMFA